MSTISGANSVIFRFISLSIALVVASTLLSCKKKKTGKLKSILPAQSAPVAAYGVNSSEKQMFNAEVAAALKAKQARENEDIKNATNAELEAALKAQKQRKSEGEKEKVVDFVKPTVIVKLEKPSGEEKVAADEKPVVTTTVLPAKVISPSKKKEDPKFVEGTVIPTKMVMLPKANVKTEAAVMAQPKEITLPPIPAAIEEEKPNNSQKNKESDKAAQENKAKEAVDAKVSKNSGKLVDKAVNNKPAAKFVKEADKPMDKNKIAEKQNVKVVAMQDKAAVKEKPVESKSPSKEAKKNVFVEKTKDQPKEQPKDQTTTTVGGTTLILQSQYIAEEDTGDGKNIAISMYVKKKK